MNYSVAIDVPQLDEGWFLLLSQSSRSSGVTTFENDVRRDKSSDFEKCITIKSQRV